MKSRDNMTPARVKLEDKFEKWGHLPGTTLGWENRERVREFFKTHLCATQTECAKALGLGLMAVNRHVRDIRSEWRNG